MRDRRFLIVGILVALAVAGGLSLFASSSPDGLEKVAGDQGFAGAATESATESSPLAGYSLSFVDGGAGQALAGILGVLLVLVLFQGLTRLLRRREPRG